tara:strand:- start:683 stop:964 length:282 start_codon:yes stop_codon:yes gene_type:complete
MSRTYTYKKNGYEFEIKSLGGNAGVREFEVKSYGVLIGKIFETTVFRSGGKAYTAEQFKQPCHSTTMFEAACELNRKFSRETGRNLFLENQTT